LSELISRPLSSPARWVVAAAALTTLAAHVVITEDHLEEALYIGVLFIALELACLVLAVLLPRRDSALVWAGVVATGALAIGAYVVSRSIGLPQITDDVGRWSDPLGVVAVTSESLMVMLGLSALTGRAQTRMSRSRLPVLVGAITLVLGLVSTDVAATASAESHDSDSVMTAEPGKASSSMGSMGSMAMGGRGYWNGVGGGKFQWDGTTRTYYISADEVAWDYAPYGFNRITGAAFDDVADTYVKTGPNRIGSTYRKCLYRGYTDPSFTRRIKRGHSQQYLGILGPVIHAVVGDRVKIVFRNNCSFSDSIHMHGLKYDKASEGAPYNDGTHGATKSDDAVAPGHTYTYRYEVPERAGPGPGDQSSVMWMYHSHTDEIADTYAGLMGPVVVTAAGRARPNGTPKHVGKEVFALFSVMNENNSPYEQYNLHHYAKPPQQGGNGPDADDYYESNLMHSINGYVFGNEPMISMHKGEHVRWYVMSMGTEVDLHTPHWHGNTVDVNGMRMDVLNLLPASMIVADMVPDDVGTWLFHCHVNDHIRAGMLTRYRVVR
jgi:manganese oxidase